MSAKGTSDNNDDGLLGDEVLDGGDYDFGEVDEEALLNENYEDHGEVTSSQQHYKNRGSEDVLDINSDVAEDEEDTTEHYSTTLEERETRISKFTQEREENTVASRGVNVERHRSQHPQQQRFYRPNRGPMAHRGARGGGGRFLQTRGRGGFGRSGPMPPRPNPSQVRPGGPVKKVLINPHFQGNRNVPVWEHAPNSNVENNNCNQRQTRLMPQPLLGRDQLMRPLMAQEQRHRPQPLLPQPFENFTQHHFEPPQQQFKPPIYNHHFSPPPAPQRLPPQMQPPTHHQQQQQHMQDLQFHVPPPQPPQYQQSSYSMQQPPPAMTQAVGQHYMQANSTNFSQPPPVILTANTSVPPPYILQQQQVQYRQQQAPPTMQPQYNEIVAPPHEVSYSNSHSSSRHLQSTIQQQQQHYHPTHDSAPLDYSREYYLPPPMVANPIDHRDSIQYHQYPPEHQLIEPPSVQHQPQYEYNYHNRSSPPLQNSPQFPSAREPQLRKPQRRVHSESPEYNVRSSSQTSSQRRVVPSQAGDREKAEREQRGGDSRQRTRPVESQFTQRQQQMVRAKVQRQPPSTATGVVSPSKRRALPNVRPVLTKSVHSRDTDVTPSSADSTTTNVVNKVEAETVEQEDEDEDTRLYRQQIAKQKEIRERILAQKEMRRLQAAKKTVATNEPVLLKSPADLAREALLINKAGLATTNPEQSANNIRPVLSACIVVRTSGVESGADTSHQLAKDKDISSFLANRKIFARDVSLPDTREVRITNLSVATNERKIRELCNGVGDIQTLDMNASGRQATIQFKSVASAHAFYKKYQRFMLDLSMINVKLAV